MKLFKMMKVQVSGTVSDNVRHNIMLFRACLNKCIIMISIYFLKPDLSTKFILFWSKLHFFGRLKKNSVKCLSKFLFKDSYRIRTAESQNYPLILFKHIISSFKKGNQRKWIFWQTHWISFCSKYCHKLLAKVDILMEWSWRPKTANFYL